MAVRSCIFRKFTTEFKTMLIVQSLPLRRIPTRISYRSPLSSYATAATTQQATSPVAESIQRAETVSKKYEQHVDEAVSRWAKNDEIYYGKERDLKNFPIVKYPEQHPKVRFGFLPDSWFQAFYSKTGVTGPYVFMFGTAMYLFSKEIWVVDSHFVEMVVFMGVSTFLIKKYGALCANFLDKHVEEVDEIKYRKPLKKLVDNLDRTITTADEEIARAAVVPMHIQAKEENLALQLEAAYRERLSQVYRAVHRRLDYHVERENTRRRYQQYHMVNWIVDQVVKGITPAQEKETLNHCIAELKRLAQVSRASPAATS